MDTLGTIAPPPSAAAEPDQRTEALERLKYLAHAGACGLLTGKPGSGKSWLFAQLAAQLRREGLAVAQIDVGGLSDAELPAQVAARLGLGVSPRIDRLELWSLLEELAEASQRTGRRMALLLDHVERADERLSAPLGRLMDLFGSSCAWLLAGAPGLAVPFEQLLHRRAWLRVELGSLERTDVARILSRELLSRDASLRLTPDAIDVAAAAAEGRIGRLCRLAELAALAAEAEESGEISGDLLRTLQQELALSGAAGGA